MSKKNAFLIHLGASFLVFIILLLMIIYVWYPAPYFDASYRMKWITVIAFVDLVIGPGTEIVATQDAARPFTPESAIRASFAAAAEHGAAVPLLDVLPAQVAPQGSATPALAEVPERP